MRAASAPSSSFARVFAWSGTALFFLSLAYFLFSYTMRFAIAAQGGNAARAITWNVVLFTVFAMHHSVFARERVRAWVARVCPPGLERSFYVWVASILFIAVCAWWQPVPGVAWRVDGAALWVLMVLQAAGVVVTLRSAAVLDIRELAGLTMRRPEGLQGSGIEFKTSGPYGWVRHPIYSGWFLMVLAVSPMTGTRLVFALVSCAYLILAIPFEERSLRALSPGTYDAYAAKVPWKLVPGVF